MDSKLGYKDISQQINEKDSPSASSDEHVLFTSEKLKPFELGYEQIKFVFVKLSEWLLTRKAELLEELREMLERLRLLYPRAYAHLMRLIQTELGQYTGSIPPPSPVSIPVQPT